MQKTYVLDTSVLLQSPQALLGFGDNLVVLPEVVLEELDNKKSDGNPEIRANVRWVARFLDQLRQEGQLYQGVAMPNGGTLKVELNCHDAQLPNGWSPDKADNRILAVAKGLFDKGQQVAVVTRDIFLRIKGDVLGIPGQDYRNEQVADLDEQYQGWRKVRLSATSFNKLYENGQVLWRAKEAASCQINEYMLVAHELNQRQTALARFDGKNICLLQDAEPNFYGMKLDTMQKFARDALTDDSIPLVTIMGATGSGKTILSLGAGLDKVTTGLYRRMLICRPNVGMGEEIGFLPGTEQDKIAPFMRPIYDNLEQLVDSKASRYKDEKELENKVAYLFERRHVVTEAIAFLQGRSIVQQWVLIDEAQNLTPKQARGIITRAGEGTKIIMVGDPGQINNPFLDGKTNGLSWAIEKMKGSPLHAHVTLTETKRSPLAMEAGQRMK
jgi:PhoH-like ATPase